MPQIHAEYIRETPSFVHVSMEITRAEAQKGTYPYGPYTLQKKAGTRRPARVAPEKQGSGEAPNKVAKVKAPVSKKPNQEAADQPDKIYEFNMMDGTKASKTLSQLKTYINNARTSARKKDSSCRKFNGVIQGLKGEYANDAYIEKLYELECNTIPNFGGTDDDSSDVDGDHESDIDIDDEHESGNEDDESGSDSGSDSGNEDDESGSDSGSDSGNEDDDQDGAITGLDQHFEAAAESRGSSPPQTDPATDTANRAENTKGETKEKNLNTGKAEPDEAKEGEDHAQAAKKKEPSATVRIDFWFYTGPGGPVKDGKSGEGIEKTKITNAAKSEGLLEAGQEAEVRPTTTTITSSALCISSSLLSHTTLETPADGTVNAEEKAPQKQEFGAQKQKKAAGAEAAETVDVDFAGFEDRLCLLAYIGNKADEAGEAAKAQGAAGDEAQGAAGAAGSKKAVDKKKVWIFYTVAPDPKEHGPKKPKRKPAEVPSETNAINGTTKIANKKVNVRNYVPSVLADNTVLDAMVDLVVRCVDDIPDYETSARVVQTIMLSDVQYVEAQAGGGDENKEEDEEEKVQTELVSMMKPDRPALAAAAADPTGDSADPAESPVGSAAGKKHGFGNDSGKLTDALKAALLNIKGEPNSIQDIVDKLYKIKLGNKIALSNFYAAVSPPTRGDVRALVVKSTDPSAVNKVDRQSHRYGVMMYPAVDKNYMVIVTKKTAKPKAADLFKLKQDPATLDHDILQSLSSQIGPPCELDNLGIACNNKHITSNEALDMIRAALKGAIKTIPIQIQIPTTTTAKTKKQANSNAQTTQRVVVLESVDEANTEKAHKKKRAIRILLTRDGIGEETRNTLVRALGALSDNSSKDTPPSQQKPSEQIGQEKQQSATATDIASSLKYITRLDELFLKYELNLDYEWNEGALDDKLNGLRVPMDADYYKWHGDRSIQRIVAQYAAFDVDVPLIVQKQPNETTTFSLFTTGTHKKYKTSELLDEYTKLDSTGKVNLHKKNLALYYTCLFVTALRDQNFGALFTSQPNFDSKPVNDNKDEQGNYDTNYTGQRPQCGSANSGSGSYINTIDPNEKTIDLGQIGKAVSFVEGLLNEGILVKREHNNTLLSYKETLADLDDKLQKIGIKEIGKYTQGGAGDSTGYTAMLGQSMKCFVMFLPLIERMIESDEKHKEAYESGKATKDFTRSNALGYGCVSHGLDPKHIIAVRYAMTKDEGTYNANSYPLSRRICKDLFDLLENGETTLPVTRELMRTRVLGAITVIDDVVRKLDQKKTKEKGSPPGSFGLVRSEHKRSSMFI